MSEQANLREALRVIINCGLETRYGLMDCIDNTGRAYQSQQLADLVHKARAALAAAPQPAPTHECPVCEETVTWTRPGSPYCGECAADNGRDVRMRSIGTAPQPAPEREALESIIYNAADAYIEEHDRRAIADALRARGLRLPGDGSRKTMAWVVVEQDAQPMLKDGYSAVAVGPRPGTWLVRVVEGGDDA